MNAKYLPVEGAAKRAGQEEFLQNVRGAVIARLIGKGLEDEEAILENLRAGVWRQAQEILVAGEF